jgi:hypothetical protein
MVVSTLSSATSIVFSPSGMFLTTFFAIVVRGTIPHDQHPRRQALDAMARRLKRLRRIQTELRNLGLDGAAGVVEVGIENMGLLPEDNPAVLVVLEMVEELKDL